MKFLILEVVGSTHPIYLNPDKINRFTTRGNLTAVLMEGGTELMSPVPAAMISERLEKLTEPLTPEKPKGPSNLLFGAARLFNRE